MKQTKRKPLLNRKETQTLLTTLKMGTIAGALSLTLGGWSLLAQLENQDIALAAANQPVAIAASLAEDTTIAPTPLPTKTASTRKKSSLDIVQWLQDISGDKVAVVRDRRGSLWYVMGSDVTRLEQGLSPLVQPQLVKVSARTRAS